MSNEYKPLILTPEEFREITQALHLAEMDEFTNTDYLSDARLSALVKVARYVGFVYEDGLIRHTPQQIEIHAKGDFAYGGRERLTPG